MAVYIRKVEDDFTVQPVTVCVDMKSRLLLDFNF